VLHDEVTLGRSAAPEALRRSNPGLNDAILSGWRIRSDGDENCGKGVNPSYCALLFLHPSAKRAEMTVCRENRESSIPVPSTM